MLIGESTLALVGDAAEVEPVEPLELQGRAEPVAAYRSWRAAKRPSGSTGCGSSGASASLPSSRRSGSACALEQRCELVTIVGDAGIGKSRLAAELLASIEAQVVRGRCLPYGEGDHVLAGRRGAEQLALPPPDEAAAATIRSLLGGDGDGGTADEIAWAFRKTLEQAAAERPLVVVLDDIHWGEETLLDLVEQVALLSSGAAILLSAWRRPELVERRPPGR